MHIKKRLIDWGSILRVVAGILFLAGIMFLATRQFRPAMVCIQISMASWCYASLLVAVIELKNRVMLPETTIENRREYDDIWAITIAVTVVGIRIAHAESLFDPTIVLFIIVLVGLILLRIFLSQSDRYKLMAILVFGVLQILLIIIWLDFARAHWSNW